MKTLIQCRWVFCGLAIGFTFSALALQSVRWGAIATLSAMIYAILEVGAWHE